MNGVDDCWTETSAVPANISGSLEFDEMSYCGQYIKALENSGRQTMAADD
jgi:hypothetical protein